MFYLVSFLTLLISLLVFMMDPAPVQVRQNLDTRTAEAYVVGFINQHQAARDYLNQWLGRVYYLDNNIQEMVGGNVVDMAPSPNAVALALPAEMEESLSIQAPQNARVRYNDNGVMQEELFGAGFVTERWTRLTGAGPDGNGYLKFDDTDNNTKGSYLSALVCLNAAGELAPCYQYVCNDVDPVPPWTYVVSTTQAGSACGSGPSIANPAQTTGNTLAGVKFADNVTPYIVTYSDNTGRNPAWWTSNGQPRALRHELWRRALANRTHSTYNCGVISSASDACAAPTAHYTWQGRGRVEAMRGPVSEANHGVYCINNGNRCMRLLPQGMEDFLNAVVSTQCPAGGAAGARSADLSGVLFCYSEVRNPYDEIVVPDWNFDGIDNKTFGAHDRFDNPDVSDRLVWYASGSQGNGRYVHWENGGWGNVGGAIGTQYAIGPNDGAGIPMPFNQVTSDFTLNVVMNFGDASGLKGNWYIGAENDSGGTLTGLSQDMMGIYGLAIDSDNRIWFYPNRTVSPIEIKTVSGQEDLLLTGLHSWTIVRRSGKMLLFLDGRSTGIEEDGEVGGGGKSVVIGKVRVGIGSIRYYSRALSDREIARNFKVDSQRYGIQEKNIGWDILPAVPGP